MQGYDPDFSALNNDDPLVHPDSKTGKRFIMGTRLQTTGDGSSGKVKHKLPSCAFHNIDCAEEGKHIQTMTQGRSICLCVPKKSQNKKTLCLPYRQ